MDAVADLMAGAENLRRWHVLRVARRWPHLEHDAESKTLEALWKAARAYRPDSGPFDALAGTWVRGAVRQVLKGDLPAGYRHRVRLGKGVYVDHVSLSDPAVARSLGAPGRVPACLEDDAPDLWGRLLSLLATDRQREVISLHFADGLGPTEIAKRLGVFEQSVANTIRQSLRRLRKALERGALA